MRKLYIDSTGKDVLENIIFIDSIEKIQELKYSYSDLEYPVDLVLDLRNLNLKGMTALLKFIENYEGTLTAIVKDPVPPALQSRFIDIVKYPLIDTTFNLEDILLSKLPNKQKQKFNELKVCTDGKL